MLHLLTNRTRYWDELGMQDECPFYFTGDELWVHDEESYGWNNVQDFWQALECFVQKDGWDHNDKFEEAVEVFSGLREKGLARLEGKEREDFKRSTHCLSRQKMIEA